MSCKYTYNNKEYSYEELLEELGNTKAKEIKNIKSTKEKIHDSLKIMEKIYSRSKNKTLLSNIRQLQNDLNFANDIDLFVSLLNNGNKYLEQVYKRINTIKSLMNELPFYKLDNQTKQDIVHQLNEAISFIQAFNILNELETISTYQDYKDIDKKVLSDTLYYKREIHKDYVDLTYDIISDWIYDESLESRIVSKDGELGGLLSRESLKEQLKLGVVDINVFEKLLGASISSSDPIQGLVASKVKELLEQARMKDFNTEKTLMYEYSKKSGNKDNPSEFNAPYLRDILSYEEVPVLDEKGKQIIDKDGAPLYEYKYVKRKGIITDFNYDLFYKTKREFFEKIGENPGVFSLFYSDWAKKVAQFFKIHTQIINPEQLIAEKRRNSTPSEFKNWLHSNTAEIENYEYDDTTSYDEMLRNNPNAVITEEFIQENDLPSSYEPSSSFFIFTGEFTSPSEIYRNKEFSKLYKTDSYFKELYDTYKNSNTVLGNSGLLMGMLPQVYKGGLDKLFDAGLSIKEQKNNVINYLDANWGVRSTDNQLGILKLDGSEHKNVPVFYTSLIEPSQVSLDLLQSILLFSKMSNSFNVLSRNEGYISILSDILEGNNGLEARKNATQKVNSVKGLLNKVIPASTNNSNEQLMSFINAVFYGEEEYKSTIKDISLNKISNNIIKYNAIITLSGNLISMFNNSIWGNYSSFNEAMAGLYFTGSNWAKAQGKYTANIPEFFLDLGRTHNQSLITQLIDYFDAIQGEYKNEYGHNVSGNTAKKLFQSDALFFCTNSAEHQIQTISLLAMIDNYKVKLNGEYVPLFEIFYKNDKGILSIKEGAEFTEKDRYNFMNRLHAVNKKLHGNYNKFDRALLQRHWFGKLIIQFRKYIYTSYVRRFSSKYIDVELQDITSGYISGAFSTLFSLLKQSIIEKQGNFILNLKNLDKEDKANFYRTSTDLVFLGALLTLGMLLANAKEDDDDDDFLVNHLLLQQRRVKGDLLFFFGTDLYKLLDTPIPAMKSNFLIIDALTQVVSDIFPTNNGEKSWFEHEKYKINSKYHKKGDIKLNYKLKRILPWYHTYQMFVNPELQANVFYKPLGR